MPAVAISDPQAPDLEGVRFTGTTGGAAHAFMLLREALEDVEYQEFSDPAALLDAFGRQQALVAECAARALAAAPTRSPVVIQSLL